MSNKNKQTIQVSQAAPSVKGKESAKSTSAAIRHPIAEMERAFDRFFGRGFPSLWSGRDFPSLDSFFGNNLFEFNGQRLPNLDVIDRDNEILVRAEVPGVDKKDLSISLTDNLLTIKGQTHSEKKEEEGDYHRQEISSSSFARAITLPGTVNASKAEASLKDGVLEITFPKSEASKKRNIAVK